MFGCESGLLCGCDYTQSWSLTTFASTTQASYSDPAYGLSTSDFLGAYVVVSKFPLDMLIN